MLSRFLLPPGPVRLFSILSGIMTLGQGLWMALNAIYAVTVVHLSPAQLGISATVAAGIVLLFSIPLGHLADRLGPRGVQMWSFLLLAPLTAALLFVTGFWSYLVVVSVQGIAYRAGRSARKAMIAGLVPSGERVKVLAYIRSACNVGVSIGAMIAGLVLASQSLLAYHGAVLLTAACFLTTGLLTAKEPKVPPVPPKPGPTFGVLRDLPFLSFTVFDGLLSTHSVLLDVVLPLWVLNHTNAPKWMSAVILLTNTILVVLVQTRAARGTDTPARSARASLQGAGCVAAACVIFAFSSGTDVWLACSLLVIGGVAHALGEVRQAAGSWGIAFELAPDHAMGQYQGTHAMGQDIGQMIAPAIFTSLTLVLGFPGWFVLAAAFLVLGAAMPPIVSLATRKRSLVAA